MSQAEIERFLAELGAAWPDDQERQAALDELRDHLLAIGEDDSLTATERAAALDKVLNELGDAGQLASKLRGESLQTNSRWIMRISTAAAALGIVALLGLASFWPGKPQQTLVSVAQAQLPPTPTPAKTVATGPAVGSTEANNLATQQKLSQRIEANFQDVPFGEVIALIGERAGVETYVNRRALAALDVDPKIELGATVSVDLKQVRADMLLDLVLQQVSFDQIDYVVRDGIVVVTSVASLDGANEVRAYPVADLLKLHGPEGRGAAASGPTPGIPGASGPEGIPGSAPPGVAPMGAAGGGFGGGGGVGGLVQVNATDELPPNVKQLIQVLQNNVSPDSWMDVGGHGTVTYFGDMLVIRQNARTHREIDKVLTLLRETAAKNAKK